MGRKGRDTVLLRTPPQEQWPTIRRDPQNRAHHRDEPPKHLILKIKGIKSRKTTEVQRTENLLIKAGAQTHLPWDPDYKLQFEKHLDHKWS